MVCKSKHKSKCHLFTVLIIMMVGWLGFTALQHFLGYIAPVSVVNVRMIARARSWGRITLHPRTVGAFSSPIPLWGCAELDEVKPFYTHRGNSWHYGLILNRQVVPASMQYECVWARVDVRWVWTTLHSRAVDELLSPSQRESPRGYIFLVASKLLVC